MPQRGSLLPYRGVLSFLSKAREALGSETPRVHYAARRRGGVAAGHERNRANGCDASACFSSSGPEPLGPFREALGDLGYVEGKNIHIEVRSAKGEDARLPELAAELVRSRVDVIVAVQTPAAHAAKNATRDIPIVMMAGDPIATGLISNLARPDGNLTGLSATAAEAAAKSLELIPEIIPGARRVGVLGNADDPFMKPFFDQIQRGAPRVRLEVHQIIVRSSDELNGAFAAIARERADAVVIQGSLPVKLTVDLALKYRLPSLSTQKSAVQAGI